jgi:hypothetical protein
LDIGSTAGIATAGPTGNVQSAGTITYSTGANYDYNGNAGAQVTGNGLNQNTPANLTINNSNGVTLSAATTISGTLTFTNGILTTTAANLLTISNTSTAAITGQSSSNYIIGPLALTLAGSIGADGTTYFYPLGDASGNYRPLELLNIRTPAPAGTHPVVEVTLAQYGAATADCGALKSVNPRNWMVAVTSNTLTSTTIRLTENGLGGTSLVGRSASQSGNYTTIGGSVAGGTISSNTGQVPGAGTYYAVGGSSGAAATVSIADNVPQIGIASVPAGTTNWVLLQAALTVAGNASTLSGLTCTTAGAGTYVSADITNIKAWYSASSTFNSGTATLLSTFTTPGIAGLKTFPAFTSQSIPVGTGYIYVTADIAATALVNDNISVNSLGTGNFTFSGCISITKSGSTSGGGVQTISPYCGTLTWIGAGAIGAGTGLNTAANWSPAVAPASCNDLIITTTTTATILVNPSVTVNSITITNNAAAGTVTLALDAQTNTLSINNDLNANVSTSSNRIKLSLRVGNGGSIVVGGNTYLGTNGNTNSWIEFMGSGGGANSTGTVTFMGNVTFGATYAPITANKIGKMIWDGTGSQTIYTNNSRSPLLNASCQIGNVNTPTVTVSPTYTGVLETDIAGNGLTVSAGATLDLGTTTWNQNAATGTLTVNGTIKLGGTTGGQTSSNFPSNYTTYTLAAGSNVVYNANGAQTIFNTPTYGSLTISNSGGHTATAGGALTISGNVSINSGSIFDGGSFTHTVAGNWTNSGTYTYNTSTVSFNSSTAAQTIGGSAATTFYNLTIDNTYGTPDQVILNVSPAASTIVTKTLTLTDGILNTTASNLLTLNAGSSVSPVGGSASSFVDGPIEKIGNTSFEFPTGNGTTYAPIAITVSIAGPISDQFTATYYHSAYGTYTLTTPAVQSLNTTSRYEWWELDRVGTTQAKVTLYTYDASVSHIINCTDLTVAHWNTAANSGAGGWENDNASETVTGFGGCLGPPIAPTTATGNIMGSNVYNSFSPFTFGSKAGSNPLPIELLFFKAACVNDKSNLTWATASETNNDYFAIERSKDAQLWETVAVMPGAGNSNSTLHYSAIDNQPYSTVTYYRLKQTDYNGNFTYSDIISASCSNESQLSMIVSQADYGVDLLVNAGNSKTLALSIFDLSGRMIFYKHISTADNQIILSPNIFSSGIYLFRLQSDTEDIIREVMIR